MTAVISLTHEADLEEWRRHARALLAAGTHFSQIIWRSPASQQSGDLFAKPSAPTHEVRAPKNVPGPLMTVPSTFMDLAQNVICHRAVDRFGLLYRILWRLRSDRHLLEVASDADVGRMTELAKAVRRDKHKMTAFVRFREIHAAGEPVFISWFEPEHHVVEATAPFFARRFAGIRWSILTPARSAHWDRNTLTFSAGATRADAPSADRLEAHWRAYFSSIFNPARLNTAAMQREMPKRYWKNMPETALIPELVRSAARRTDDMIDAPPTVPRKAAATQASLSIDEPAPLGADALPARDDLDACRRCGLWEPATQGVPGEGPATAGTIFVGEQPGDMEDLAGRPFIGPAGQLFDRALAAADIDRKGVYVTNAVKHFKFEPRGKRRIHSKPNGAEVTACRWWLDREIAMLKPRLIVALGATAAASLVGKSVTITSMRGKFMTRPDGAELFVTVHPSYLLRITDQGAATAEWDKFVADLRLVRKHMTSTEISASGAAKG